METSIVIIYGSFLVHIYNYDVTQIIKGNFTIKDY